MKIIKYILVLLGIFVFQDVRGKFMSEGEFVNMRPQDTYKRGKNATDDATDSCDTVYCE